MPLPFAPCTSRWMFVIICVWPGSSDLFWVRRHQGFLIDQMFQRLDVVKYLVFKISDSVYSRRVSADRNIRIGKLSVLQCLGAR